MKALLLCASHNDLGLILSLKKLGYYIVVIGKIPNLIGQKYADKYIQIDYSDKDAVLQLARKEKIDVVCQCCNDFGVYTAAYVAEHMNLPGYDSYDTTVLLHNKDKFKKFTKKYNILSPISEVFDTYNMALKYKNAANYPCIIKPADASAGNGISKVECEEEYIDALKTAFDYSRIKNVVIEPFLEGTQHGFCTFIKDKKVIAYCNNNEYSVMNPFRVEIDTFPADTDSQVCKMIIYEIEKIAQILNLSDGIFHLQYIMSNGKPYIIEVMRRILGNMYSIPASMITNFNWDYWETRAKCGLSCDAIPQRVHQEGFYAYKTVLATTNGIIERIEIPEKYEKYIIGKCFIRGVNDEIKNYRSEPVGFLFMNFNSQKEMKHKLIDEYENDMVKMWR